MSGALSQLRRQIPNNRENKSFWVPDIFLKKGKLCNQLRSSPSGRPNISACASNTFRSALIPPALRATGGIEEFQLHLSSPYQISQNNNANCSHRPKPIRQNQAFGNFPNLQLRRLRLNNIIAGGRIKTIRQIYHFMFSFMFTSACTSSNPQAKEQTCVRLRPWYFGIRIRAFGLRSEVFGLRPSVCRRRPVQSLVQEARQPASQPG